MSEIALAPLLPSDPPHVGDYWLDARLHARASGVAFIAHDDETRVRLVLMSDGAASDKAARDRFSGLINRLPIDDVIARGGHEQDRGRLGKRFREPREAPTAADNGPLAPWVAMPWHRTHEEIAEVDALLRGVELADIAQPHGSGPDYEHYWIKNTRVGRTRIWPLPWPGRGDRAGWLSILVSWLLMLLIATVALLLAIWLFRHSEPVPEPPPVQPPPQSSSASPQSPPPSASPSPSDDPSPSESPSDSASPSPSSGESDTPEADGSPTPPSRL